MARPYRRLILGAGIALTALVLLGIAAVAVLVLFVDADTFRPRIERLASQQLGRNVALGHLDWDLGWRLGLASEGGSLANLPGFEGEAIASWKRIEFGLALRPLFRRKVQVDHLALDGLVMDLQKNAEGQTNWKFPDAPKEASDGTTSIGIESVSLTDARVRYRDAATGADWRVEGFALEVELPGGQLDTLDSLQDLAMSGQLYGGPLGTQGVTFSLDTDLLRFDREKSRISVPAFRARLDQSTLEGGVEGGLGAQQGQSPHATADIRLAVPVLREQLARLGIEMSPKRDPTTLGAFSLSAQVEYEADALRLEKLLVKLDDTQLQGSASLPDLSPLAVRFTLQADQIDLDRYLEPAEFEGDPLELPVARLKALDAKGVLHIAAARVAGADATDVEIKVE